MLTIRRATQEEQARLEQLTERLEANDDETRDGAFEDLEQEDWDEVNELADTYDTFEDALEKGQDREKHTWVLAEDKEGRLWRKRT